MDVIHLVPETPEVCAKGLRLRSSMTTTLDHHHVPPPLVYLTYIDKFEVGTPTPIHIEFTQRQVVELVFVLHDHFFPARPCDMNHHGPNLDHSLFSAMRAPCCRCFEWKDQFSTLLGYFNFCKPLSGSHSVRNASSTRLIRFCPIPITKAVKTSANGTEQTKLM